MRKAKDLRREVLRFFGNHLLVVLVGVLCKTLKFKFINSDVIKKLDAEKKNFVLAFWHGTMIIPWYIHRNKKFVALTSKSKDGDMLANLLKHWNYVVVRGSSSKGGNIALGIMVDYAKNKCSIAITPDGPKGPIHRLKPGAVITAKKSNVPLVLMGIGVSNKKILKSWDKFEIPKLFSKVKIVYSDAIYIDSNLSFEDTSKKIDECEFILTQLQDEAETF